jgi:hypothetical protein
MESTQILDLAFSLDEGKYESLQTEKFGMVIGHTNINLILNLFPVLGILYT